MSHRKRLSKGREWVSGTGRRNNEKNQTQKGGREHLGSLSPTKETNLKLPENKYNIGTQRFTAELNPKSGVIFKNWSKVRF